MRARDRLRDLHQRAAVHGLAEAADVEAGGGDGVCGDTTEPLLSAAAAAADDPLRDLLEEVDRVRCWVRDMERNTALVRALHADPAFHANKQLQEQLDAAVTENNALALKASGALRQLQPATAAAGAAGVAGAAGAAGRARRLQAACWRRLYARALRRHHAALAALRRDHLQLLRDQLVLTGAGAALSEEECEGLLDTDNIALFVDNVVAETAAARAALRSAEARRDELRRVEAALADLHALFLQLAHLVAAQQEQVDTVEYYALAAGERVDSGGRQLLRGAAGHARARKKKLSLVLCVTAGCLVVLLVLVLT